MHVIVYTGGLGKSVQPGTHEQPNSHFIELGPLICGKYTGNEDIHIVIHCLCMGGLLMWLHVKCTIVEGDLPGAYLCIFCCNRWIALLMSA